jgi:hypothetical protein
MELSVNSNIGELQVLLNQFEEIVKKIESFEIKIHSYSTVPSVPHQDQQ